MSKPLVPDELWETIAPLLPKHKARPRKRGRPPVDDRAALTGIIFVLQSGIPWNMLPREMGCGSGVSCWRRLRHWQRRGVWRKLLAAMLQKWRTSGASTGPRSCSTASRSARFLGGADRPEPHGPCEEREQTPPAGRRQGDADGAADHRRQPPRLDAGDEVDRRDPADPAPRARPAATPPCGRLRRPRLRHAGQPPWPEAKAHQGPPCLPPTAARQRVGARATGRRAGVVLNGPSTTAQDPV